MNSESLKTIIFYSPKGGVGKSLAAVNFAACVARCKKNCVLIDLDLEAPSLHFKIPTLGYSGGAGGFVSLWRESLIRTPNVAPPSEPINSASNIDSLTAWQWLRGQPANFQLKAVTKEDLKDRSNDRIPAWEAETRWNIESLEPVHKEHGRVHLLPAGDISRNEYWDTVLSPLWWKAVNSYAGHKAEAVEPELPAKVKGWFVELKKALIEAIPELDYAIVDFRSGALDPAALVADAFTTRDANTSPADRFKDLKIVCMFSRNMDSLMHLSKVWPKVKAFGIPVLSRISGTVKVSDAVPEVLSMLGIGNKELILLHTDRAIEEAEFLLFGLNQATIKNSRLTHEYLQLFARLLEWNGGVDDLRKELGIPPDPAARSRWPSPSARSH